MHKPVYNPEEAGNKLTMVPWSTKQDAEQKTFL